MVGQSLTLAGIGIAVGLVGGALLTRFLDTMLFDLTPLDPEVFLAAPLVFGFVVAVAALLSARPATTMAPFEALRRD